MKHLVSVLAACLFLLASGSPEAAEPIKIGAVFSVRSRCGHRHAHQTGYSNGG